MLELVGILAVFAIALTFMSDVASSAWSLARAPKRRDSIRVADSDLSAP